MERDVIGVEYPLEGQCSDTPERIELIGSETPGGL